ncbi:MAG: hypothetical protein K2N73_18280 [Lachnospiraceae bacterium]|nr:hypothetical protein [Lachnospiraceae bacterium]
METGHDDGEYYVENITDEEREICRRVVSAYEEEFENMEILVVEAGKYGFYKMLFSSFPTEVDDAIVFTSGMELFNDLWEEWLEAQLLMLMKDTPMLELDYDEMLECLPEEKREELMAKRQYFAQKAGIV